MSQMLNKNSDKELLLQLNGGSYAAFSIIYEKYWNVIFIHVFRILKNKEDTRDIVQDTFTRLWQNAKLINADVNLGGYIYLIAKNKVIDYIGKKRVQEKHLKSLAYYIEAHANETLKQVTEKELSYAMELEIKNLPPKMKQIFELRLKGHYTYAEIAQILNVSDKTVKKQVSNAIKILTPKMRNLSIWAALYYLLK